MGRSDKAQGKEKSRQVITMYPSCAHEDYIGFDR